MQAVWFAKRALQVRLNRGKLETKSFPRIFKDQWLRSGHPKKRDALPVI
jgi:hypothetical protein